MEQVTSSLLPCPEGSEKQSWSRAQAFSQDSLTVAGMILTKVGSHFDASFPPPVVSLQ